MGPPVGDSLVTEAEKKANGEFKRAKGLEGFGKFLG